MTPETATRPRASLRRAAAWLGLVAALALAGCGQQATAPAPTPPAGDPASVQPSVIAGNEHACAVRSSGTVFCWGLGDGGGNAPPVGLSNVTQVTAGAFFGCALKTDGTVVCWGNSYPVPSNLQGQVTQISSTYQDTCVLKRDGTAACFGESGFPTSPDGVTTIKMVATGSGFACTLTTGGEVGCFSSQIRNDRQAQTAVPGGVSGFTTWISSGTNHACAVKTDDTAVCWGDDSFGQMDVPAGLTGVARVSAGDQHTCALKRDRTVVCWGANDFGETDVPAGLADVTQLSAGQGFTCVLKGNRDVVCWGVNDSGETNVPKWLLPL